jgi:hypothetical protein
MDAAATAYVALTAAGTDALLIAADHALRKDWAGCLTPSGDSMMPSV